MKAYDYMLEQKEKVRTTRKRLRDTLIEMGFDVPYSQSNFLLARWRGIPTAAEIFAELRKHNILVRYFAQPRLEDALRITIGTDAETDALLAALRLILGIQ